MQLQQAHTTVNQLIAMLTPFCDKIKVAGSVRRQVQQVNDLEIVCLPKWVTTYDLFEQPIGSIRSKEFATAVATIGQPVRGNALTGRYLRCQINGTGIELDLFMPQAHDYYRILAIRTGSSNYSKRIADAWLKAGWCGTPNGLRKIKECTQILTGGKHIWKCYEKNPSLPPVWKSEADFFTWVGMPFIKPENRL